MSTANLTASPGPEWEGYDLNNALSSFYWGTVVSYVLAGITLLQAYNYFPSRDKLLIQICAAIMITLDVGSTVLCADGMYIYFIPHYGSLLPLASLTPSLAVECYLSVIITLISQMYFAWQIWIVMKNDGKLKYFLSGSVAFFGIVAFAAGLACATAMLIDRDRILGNRSLRFEVTTGVSKCAAVVCDVLATVGLCCFLKESQTGFKRTDSVIKKLIQYIMRRGVLVTVVQLLFIILYYGPSRHLYWLAVHANSTRLYANTFFVMLNAREHIRNSPSEAASTYPGGSHVMSLDSSNPHYVGKESYKEETDFVSSWARHPGPHVSIETTVHEDRV